MEDAYWNNRQASLHQSVSAKRPRSEFDLPPSGLTVESGIRGYLGQDDDWTGPQPLKDTESLMSAYDKYLQSSRLSSEDGGRYGQLGLRRAVHGDMPAFSMRYPDRAGFPEAFSPELTPKGRDMSYSGRLQETLPLPPDASNTLYVEGLPENCTKREVAHIFRPFVGYKEVRLVRKESKHRGGDYVSFSFVDFIDEACAATALSVLQGYVMDEDNPDSPCLRLQFSKFPGPRSSSWRH